MPLLNESSMELSPDISKITFTLASGAINYVEYNLLTKDAECHFSDGTVYNYSEVPIEVVSQWISAASCGAYFNYNVRKNYAFQRIG